MTIQEFSNTFDTFLNSYNTQAMFGEQASKADIVLDEYEKSVLLTQAQDIIVKQYFDRTLNPQGQGFDDSTRRQVDFSSLIKNTHKPVAFLPNEGDITFPSGVLTIKNNTGKNIIINVRDSEVSEHPNDNFVTVNKNTQRETVTYNLELSNDATIDSEFEFILDQFVSELSTALDGMEVTVKSWDDPDDIMSGKVNPSSISLYPEPNTYDERGQLVTLDSDILFILNEKVIDTKGKSYVVIPINYKEYDRQMSKAYTQPLKKQAWRLFESADNLGLTAEVIPIAGVIIAQYKVRYVRRPRPIILADLAEDGLDIDGKSRPYDDGIACELNPIIHMDILNKAVELAITTRGGRVPVSNQQSTTTRNS